MPLWPCDFANCAAPAVQRAGDCVLCGSHFCRIHLQDEWHKCPKPENWKEYSAQFVATESRYLEELCQRINTQQLCSRASQARDAGANIPCSVNLSHKGLLAAMGGQNCHAEVLFADGLVWMVRFRMLGSKSPPVEVRDYVLRSEVASMQFLQSHTSIPSPRVYDWACESDLSNKVGIGYILMEKMPGSPLDWQQANTAQRHKIVRQLAEIMLEVENHPFSALGSLMALPESRVQEEIATVQGLAQHSTFKLGTESTPLGPFYSSWHAMRTMVEEYLGMIVSGEIGTAANAVDTFLAHRFRIEVLDDIWKPAVGEGNGNETFFLKHADDKGDHIFVNDDYDIVGIIDWEWCSTTSKEEAFSSPCMMWPVATFYDGANDLADEEIFLARELSGKGRDDLAHYVLNGRKVQRFLFSLGPGGAHEDKKTFAQLFMGLKRAFDINGNVALGREEEQWEVWKADAIRKWKHEKMFQALLANL